MTATCSVTCTDTLIVAGEPARPAEQGGLL